MCYNKLHLYKNSDGKHLGVAATDKEHSAAAPGITWNTDDNNNRCRVCSPPPLFCAEEAIFHSRAVLANIAFCDNENVLLRHCPIW